MKNIHELVAEMDQRNIDEIKNRIALANLLASEIDDKIFSGEPLPSIKRKELIKTAKRNRTFLIKVQKDPKLKIYLHLQENAAISENLSRQLEKSLIDAIDRLTASISLLESEITTDRVIKNISCLRDACKGQKQFEAITTWFIEEKCCDAGSFAWNRNIYPLHVLAGYLKDLNTKGYTNKLGHKSIQAIALNSFHTEMSLDTIKRANIPTPGIPFFKI